jgi:hypothetical protein
MLSRRLLSERHYLHNWTLRRALSLKNASFVDTTRCDTRERKSLVSKPSVTSGGRKPTPLPIRYQHREGQSRLGALHRPVCDISQTTERHARRRRGLTSAIGSSYLVRVGRTTQNLRQGTLLSKSAPSDYRGDLMSVSGPRI